MAARVWNEAKWRPEAQISLRTGFIVQGATDAEKSINTNDSWTCIQDSSYAPLKFSIPAYYVSGPGELIDLARQPKNWKQTGFQDTNWKQAQRIFPGTPKNIIGGYGTQRQTFTPLLFRIYRYVQIRVITKNEALVIDDIYSTFTGFPFQFNAVLTSDRTEMNKMLEIGWRTARLCAFETYMDCPYYEQLQYIGDTRIQSMVSLYNSGDERLLRNALDQMDESRQPEGVTLSRHPSYTPQYIPTFSLWYIGMLHDYARYGKDLAFVKEKLPGQRQILDYFSDFQQSDGSLKDVPNWMFTDWVTAEDWIAGVGPMGKDHTSALLDLQLLWAYQNAADLESNMGMKAYAAIYTDAAEQLKATIKSKYWDDNKKLFADRSEKDLFSQDANILAILTGMLEKEEAAQLGRQLLTDTTLAPASTYFKYYLHQAITGSTIY